jgi:ketosteroid isomerase-like protein
LTEEERLLRAAYEAFNARDIEGALELMDPDVDWPNGMEGRSGDMPPSGRTGRGSSD